MKLKIGLSKKITAVVLIILIFFGLIHYVLPGFITVIKHPLITLFRPVKPVQRSNSAMEKVAFVSHDGIRLKANLSSSSAIKEKGSIILLHGIRSNKESFSKLIPRLNEKGYTTIALDSRGHGESEGKHCTFGVKEKKDISALIDELLKSEKISKNIGVWGQSLGGAIALQAMGIDKRIRFGIIESTFSDFRTITHDYMKYHIGFNIPLLTNYLINRAGEQAGFDPDQAKPVVFCQLIDQPVFMAHGTDDKRIDITYAKKNFGLLKSSEKQFLKIENAGHLNVWKVGGETYFEKVFSFLGKLEK